MKKILLTFFTIGCIFPIASAQYVDQALIFSQQYYGTTARSKAMGSAFGALGGDFSSLSLNPAGIAVYIKPEFSSSFGIVDIKNTETTYQGQMANDQSTKFNIRNLGYVFTQPTLNSGSGLVSFNFGFGYNRLNDFNQNIMTQAGNSAYSRTDAFAQNSNGIVSTDLLQENHPYENINVPWESEMAWQTYLINVSNPDQSGVGNQYQSILFPNELVNQSEWINREGYVNEYPLSFGLNFSNKFYMGMTFGMQDLYYNETKTYSENGDFGRFDYMSYASTHGFGYNFKFGMIFRPIPELRIGGAVHTPTFYNIRENYNSVMTSNLQNVSAEADGPHNEPTPLGDYEYEMETPFRAIGSVAFQFGNNGLLSVDYEYVDYANMKLRHGRDGYNFGAENQEISSIYNGVSNIHIGGELRASNNVSLRAGYEYFGNPYKSVINGIPQPNMDFTHSTINGGLGFRSGNLILDLAYGLGIRDNYMYIYQINGVDVSPVKYHTLNHQFVLSFAYKF